MYMIVHDCTYTYMSGGQSISLCHVVALAAIAGRAHAAYRYDQLCFDTAEAKIHLPAGRTTGALVTAEEGITSACCWQQLPLPAPAMASTSATGRVGDILACLVAWTPAGPALCTLGLALALALAAHLYHRRRQRLCCPVATPTGPRLWVRRSVPGNCGRAVAGEELACIRTGDSIMCQLTPILEEVDGGQRLEV